MQTRWPALLGVAMTLLTSDAAGQTGPSYSLKEIRAMARSVHPSLDSAEAAVEAAAGMLREARAYPNPEIAVGFGRGRPRGGADSGSEESFGLVQPVELPGIRRWKARSTELRARGIELDRALARAVVDSTVSRLAYTVLLEQRRTEIAGESADVAFRLHELLQRRVELGESSPLEAVRARSEWFARRRDVIDARSALEAARSALGLFCGGGLPEEYVIQETLEGSGAIALPPDLVDRLRAQNPTLLRSAIAVEEAQARTEVARKEIFPRFDVMASHETELDKKATSVGFGLTIPLWNRNRGAIAAAAAEQIRAAAETRALGQEYERELARLIVAYRGARTAIRLHDDGWTATARQALEISTFSFENGEASLLDVLDAQRMYLGVRSAEAESWARLALARADIELLLAGPLETENSDEAR